VLPRLAPTPAPPAREARLGGTEVCRATSRWSEEGGARGRGWALGTQTHHRSKAMRLLCEIGEAGCVERDGVPEAVAVVVASVWLVVGELAATAAAHAHTQRRVAGQRHAVATRIVLQAAVRVPGARGQRQDGCALQLDRVHAPACAKAT
jgi:hypothetical protein